MTAGTPAHPGRSGCPRASTRAAIGHGPRYRRDTHDRCLLDVDRGKHWGRVYGAHAEAAVRRLDEIEHVGDIGVISAYDPETEEIGAFEELIGAHGGLGGSQTKPFLVHPAEWELDLAPLLGAPMVYRQLRGWMERELGMTLGLTRERATEERGR